MIAPGVSSGGAALLMAAAVGAGIGGGVGIAVGVGGGVGTAVGVGGGGGVGVAVARGVAVGTGDGNTGLLAAGMSQAMSSRDRIVKIANRRSRKAHIRLVMQLGGAEV